MEPILGTGAERHDSPGLPQLRDDQRQFPRPCQRQGYKAIQADQLQKVTRAEMCVNRKKDGKGRGKG